jgi:hypothetical protein
VKDGIEAGRIKPSLRAIYAAEGASQEVAQRNLSHPNMQASSSQPARAGTTTALGNGASRMDFGNRLTSALTYLPRNEKAQLKSWAKSLI